VSVQTRHIAIDIRVDGDEISGHAGDGTGQPLAFTGWLGLIGALDGLIPRAPDGPYAQGGATWNSGSASASQA
jgi:hypothetical protein